MDQNPFLQDGHAPVSDERTDADLRVRGTIPEGITGVYLRNGPNPAYPPLAYNYPFDGDGMIHALSLQHGRAAYRNRFIMTPGLRAERRAGRALYGSVIAPIPVDPALVGPDGDPGPIKNTANTHVVHHAGRTLALWEGGLPTALAPDLATIGFYDFDGRLHTALTAHPKIDAATGEMLAFRYGTTPPYLVYMVIDAAGTLVREVPLDLPFAVMVHDFAVTEHHAVFFLCPVVLNAPSAPPLAWLPERGTRIAVVPRDGSGEVRWFETDAFFVFHFMNAAAQGDRITVDYVQYAAFGRLRSGGAPCLWRMELDLAAGTATRRQLHEHVAEFPRIDPAMEGRPYRYGWSPILVGERDGFGALARYDHETGKVAVHAFDSAEDVGEPVFIPRHGATPEADGWIGAYVYDRRTDASRFVLLDAVDLAAPPIAEIMLPRRVPQGFHGSWVPGPPHNVGA
jgi:carotenoid cleavage dioxygenase